MQPASTEPASSDPVSKAADETAREHPLPAASTEIAGLEITDLKDALQELQSTTDLWDRLAQQIKSVSEEGDLDAAKAGLAATVVAARAKSVEQHRKLGSLLSNILNKLYATPNVAGAAPGFEGQPESGPKTDPLTGLLTRPSAETDLTRTCGEPADCFLAMFVVKRVALINARFGYARGDQVLLKVVLHLMQLLPNFNGLYRWAPCAFLGIPPANTSNKEMRSRIQTIELARLTATLEWEGRSAMVPVAMDCRIVSVKDFPTPSELFLRLDTLAADA